MTKVSIVLISKNQEWNIERLITSALQHSNFIPSKEIVLVDSASTDRTIELAYRHPITILQLRADQRLTAAAGRYIGHKHSPADYVLFLDGDMELYPGWLERAIEVLENNADIAVITGHILDLAKTATDNVKPLWFQEQSGELLNLTHASGAGLYKGEVLEEAGSFNPYIYSDEEPELCIRIRHKGYRIVQLDYPIVYHYTDPHEDLATPIKRWRRNLYLGYGQNLRYHYGSDMFWTHIKERGYGLPPALGLIAGLVSVICSLRTGNKLWIILWFLGGIGAISGLAYYKGSLYLVIRRLLERFLVLDGMLKGIFLKPLDPKDYPCNLNIVKIAVSNQE